MPSFASSAVAVCIFLFVTINFLFPCNRFVPLDRRTISVVGAVMCYISRTGIDNLHAVNFDVMILLSSIMTVNHLVIHLKETKAVITYMQQLVQLNPVRGLWVLALSAYVTSPFLTNDGVCLLFVEPILQAFEHAPLDLAPTSEEEDGTSSTTMKLRKADAIFFLLALACSANIGSALTYTGNPQNMIVSSDAIGVMPSYMFFIFMLPASMFSWIITMKWIERCWLQSRQQQREALRPSSDFSSPMHPLATCEEEEGVEMTAIDTDCSDGGRDSSRSTRTDRARLLNGTADTSWAKVSLRKLHQLLLPFVQPAKRSHELVVSPRRKIALAKAQAARADAFFVASPFPHAVPLLLCGMIAMIFAGTIPISGTVCLFAVLMIVTVVVGNHYRGQQTWIAVNCSSSSSSPPDDANGALGTKESSSFKFKEALVPTFEAFSTKENENESARGQFSPPSSLVQSAELGPLTREDEVDNLNRFFEALYGSIDYNVLLIFLGLFIVIDNLSFTGIPRTIWNGIVGKAPFRSFGSTLGICVFVVVASQFLGNVPVIQLAKPNVQGLDDHTKRLAWALLSFVSTVAGNLTLTGSAANIIVAEKAARLDSSMAIDFFRHFHVCFWVTLLSCTVGALMITAMVEIEFAAEGGRR